MRIGAIEGGGTKMVVGVGDETGRVEKQASFPTTTPEETLPKLIGWLKGERLDALGVASFGPVDCHAGSATYGYITSTPKAGWRDTPFLPILQDALGVPAGFDNDVNAAALAEWRLGVGRGTRNMVYVTVGTGIGGGVIVDSRVVHGLVHPEIGHILMRPHPLDPMPDGICPFHKGCLEGLAAGPAIAARAGADGASLPDDHPAMAIEAYYLGQMCANLVLTLSPERIVLGGGVMRREALLRATRKETLRFLGGYVQSPALLDHIDEYIVAPALYPISGLCGALLLGAESERHPVGGTERE